MSGPEESRYADLLKELGFKRWVPRAHPVAIRCEPAEDIDTPPQSVVPVYVPPPELPCFLTIGGILHITYAWDEHGNMWLCEDEEIDMGVHGFSPMLESFPLQ